MIENYYQYSEKLASGAQPSAEDIVELKKDDFEVVFNISTPSARNVLINEAAIVEKEGMYYVHFPIDCSNLQPIHYKTFKGIMDGLADKKTFVHCGANIKSSNLLHMYDVLAKRKDEKESIHTLYKIQQPEEKWFKYFEIMGMKGER